MAEPSESRVAVYIDFDNIVISRFAQVNGRTSKKLKDLDPSDPATAKLLDDARVDLGAVLDFASSFGTVAVSRAYADWSVPANITYSRQLTDRAIDLIQLFPTVQSGKNGADIRLALDAADDMVRFPYLTHVVIVAGDSDYIALAQRCKQADRYVVGIGVTGSVAPAFVLACNEFKYYDALPGIPALAKPAQAKAAKTPAVADPKQDAVTLLAKALELAEAKDSNEWQHLSTIKNQMRRLDPKFDEGPLGYSSFTKFVKDFPEQFELDGATPPRVRLKPRG